MPNPFTYVYSVPKTDHCCCSKIQLDLDKDTNIVSNIIFVGGCRGNQKAVSRLVNGKTVDEINSTLSDILCPGKVRSCSQELCQATLAALKAAKE